MRLLLMIVPPHSFVPCPWLPSHASSRDLFSEPPHFLSFLMGGQSKCKSPVPVSSESSSSFPFTGPVPLAVVPESMVPTSAPSRSMKHYEEWVSLDVLKQVSSVMPTEVDTLVTKGTWVDPYSAHDFIMMAPFDYERVCHAAREDEDDFIFMYETIFEDLGISLPIGFFYAEVLQMFRIAPSQLHPNSWATLWAFETICRALSIEPTAPLLFFLLYRPAQPGATWVSLTAMRCMNLFRPYLESYKGFKTHNVKELLVKDAPLTKSGYDLGAIMQQNQTAAGSKIVK
ncbi:hypothetical protein CR513_41561, partial [Mucuna pruriens]